MNKREIIRRLVTTGTVAGSVAGCGGPDHPRQSFENRIIPPVIAPRQPQAGTAGDELKQVRADLPAPTPVPAAPPSVEPATTAADVHAATGPLSLPDAVALAYRLQPRLRVFLEGVVQAKGAETVAIAPFLPTAVVGYSAGGFDLNAGGSPIAFGTGTPNFTFLPFNGAIPVGLNLNTGYELAELKVQWLLADFGRRMGRYEQTRLGVNVAQLQTDRAYQTVANDVALAYYQVLRARSLERIAVEAVRRAADDLDVAKKLEKGGVVEREKTLRAEVAVAQAQRGLDAAEAGYGIAIVALNLAIGLNANTPTEVLPSPDAPEFGLTLTECLGEAVSRRRELEVAQLSVRAAQVGGRIARAEFRPKVVAGGSLINFQQSAPRAHADLALGSIKLEWGVFEGGKRVGEIRIADSKTRAASAQAEALADTIAFQVNESYRHAVVARRGIERSKPAVEQAREAYRLLRARAAKGDATPAEVTEAETALTRAEQDFLNSTYDYMTAVTRLNFAIGLPPVPTEAAPASDTDGAGRTGREVAPQ